MIRCCAFGTVRIDIHAFQDINELDNHEEIKIHEMSMKVGGSVFNTVSVMNALNIDSVLYMLNANDELADYIKIKLKNKNINFILCKQDQNDIATSIIFVDKTGNKKIISYEGVRRDKYILKQLVKEIGQYDLFYTSFYEISKDNYSDIVAIMSGCATNFVDLSPLIYEIEPEVVKSVLEKVQVLSGTRDEYEILINKLGMQTYIDLIERFNIRYLFVKKGSEGASLYKRDAVYEYKPSVIRSSHDTTGCGDTFSAGVIRGLSENWEDRKILSNAVEMATKVAYEGFNPCLFEDWDN